MKIKTKCITCLLSVRESELERLQLSQTNKLNCMIELTKLYIKLLETNIRTPAEISTQLFRQLKKMTGNEDPYKREKIQANREAIRIYKNLKSKTQALNEEGRLALAIKTSLAGNSLDLGVAGYQFNIDSVLDEIKEVRPAIDDSWIFENIRDLRIVFLLDNCGEAVLDRLLAEEFRTRKAYTIAIVKGGSFQNDITINDIKNAGLEKSFDEVISTGTDAASIFLDEISEKAKRIIFSSDIVVSKGMAHFEYLEEIKNSFDSKIVFMLRAKCQPIAETLKVPLGSYVIKIA